jgi:hypothetical protein
VFLRALAARIEDDPAFGHALLALLHESGLLSPSPSTQNRVFAADIAKQARRKEDGVDEGRTLSSPSPSVASAAKSAAPAPLDPFAELRGHGEAELRAALANLDLAALRQIVRVFRLDPARISARWKTSERVIDLIVEQVRARADLGRAFERI